MIDSKNKIKKTVSFNFNSNINLQQKNQLSINNMNKNNSEKNIFKNKNIKNNNNNKNINIELNSISIGNNINRLTNSLSKSCLDIHNPNNINEINIIKHSTIEPYSNNKTILINKKSLFKKSFNKHIKNPLYKSYNYYVNKNINNSKFNNSNVNKSINQLDSKTLEETKSKIENSNIINNESNINKNNNENESIINSNNKNEQILLPKITSSIKKKNYKKKHIPFIIKCKNKKISANDIYLHYLKENENDKDKIDNLPTIFDFAQYLKQIDYKKFNYGFNKIYGEDQSFNNIMNEIKKNKNIAFKKDFNIQDYQKTLLKLLKKRISDKSLEKLESRYKLFNERNYGMIIPRGRYISLADRLKDFLSKEIFEKVKRMDKNYIIFLEKKEELKHRNSIEFANKNNFYKKLNNTIISFNRKRKTNKSI